MIRMDCMNGMNICDARGTRMKSTDGKHIFGTVKVGARGQIVIPKEARDIFDIEPGDTLLVLGDEAQGIAIVKNEVFKQFAEDILSVQERPEQDR